MKIEQFRDALDKLFAESIDLPRQEILEELELQCDCLRDVISDIRIRPRPDDSNQKPTQNATQRADDQPVRDRVYTNPPRPAHSRHPMFED
jgi:transposase